MNFIVSFHLFLIVYFNSNFLSNEGLSDRSVSLVYIIGSLVGILGLLLLPKILHTLGAYKTVLTLIFIEFVFFLILALTKDLSTTLLAFLGYLLCYPLILVCFDIFLEGTIKNEDTTGGIRAIFLTVTNSVLIIAPLTAGFLLSGENFSSLYLIAGSFLIPLFVIIAWYFKDFTDPKYCQITYGPTIKKFSKEKNLRNIFIAHFALRFFFSFMVIYTPLFLHNTIGFSFSTIGFLFAIMLLPFVIFEIPLGKIADRWLGEKEILIAGLLIAGLSTIVMSFTTTSVFLLWALLLFTTRIGASAIEIMTESFFFKQVTENDADTISLFRMLRPLGYIAGPVLGVIGLSVMDIQFIFIIPGVILLLGILFVSQIKDTK